MKIVGFRNTFARAFLKETVIKYLIVDIEPIHMKYLFKTAAKSKVLGRREVLLNFKGIFIWQSVASQTICQMNFYNGYVLNTWLRLRVGWTRGG